MGHDASACCGAESRGHEDYPYNGNQSSHWFPPYGYRDIRASGMLIFG
jgi:hypothetical protein